MQDVAIAPGFHFGAPVALGILFLGVALAVAVAVMSHTGGRPFTPALVYLALGVVAAVFVHLLGVDWNDPTRMPEPLQRLSELALIIALFGAGMRFGTRPPWPQRRAVFALLAGTMPATVVLVAVFGVYAMGLSVGAAVLLGAMLAPTDPVLAGDMGVPPPGRQAESTRPPHVVISGEAGLNDGLATPLVLLGLLVATHDEPSWVAGWLGVDVVYTIGVGLAIGGTVGYGLGALVLHLREREHLSPEFETFVALACAFLVYGAAQAAGALGLLAAFVAGTAFRRRERTHDYMENVHTGAERIEKLLTLAVVLVLGSVLTLEALAEPGLAGWLLAPCLLLGIRPLTALPALVGSPLEWRGRAFVAWFGVRGVATIFYAAAVVASGVLEEAEATRVFWTAAAVVMVSIVVHGLTSPLGRVADQAAPAREEPEHGPMEWLERAVTARAAARRRGSPPPRGRPRR